jgi:hypothetical protein
MDNNRSSGSFDSDTVARLQQERARLVAFVKEFASTHDIDGMTTDELDLWIERLRPIRLEIHRIDMALKRLTAAPGRD